MKASSSKVMTKGALTSALAEEHELKQKVCREEKRHFHDSWPLPHQNSCEASDEGRSEDDVWRREESQGTAGKDCRESLPRCRSQEADLSNLHSDHPSLSRSLSVVGIPQGGLERYLRLWCVISRLTVHETPRLQE